MSELKDKAEQVKGHAKEAAGDVTDNDRLRREGKADQAAGKAKEKLGDVKDKIGDAIDDVKEKIDRR
jgi:uncharacterized protein YjbJ (UPF0337 family)